MQIIAWLDCFFEGMASVTIFLSQALFIASCHERSLMHVSSQSFLIWCSSGKGWSHDFVESEMQARKTETWIIKGSVRTNEPSLSERLCLIQSVKNLSAFFVSHAIPIDAWKRSLCISFVVMDNMISHFSTSSAATKGLLESGSKKDQEWKDSGNLSFQNEVHPQKNCSIDLHHCSTFMHAVHFPWLYYLKKYMKLKFKRVN